MAELTWEFVHNIAEPFVWLNVQQFEQFWQTSKEYIGPSGAGSPYGNQRYNAVGVFIREHCLLYYPVISLQGLEPIFTDGRHRTAWLRDHGAEAIPFICPEEDALVLNELCGTSSRKTLFQKMR